jgi:hypothetical protein
MRNQNSTIAKVTKSPQIPLALVLNKIVSLPEFLNVNLNTAV